MTSRSSLAGAATSSATYPPGAPKTYKPSIDTVGFIPAGQSSLTQYPNTGGPLGNITASGLIVTTPNVDVSGYEFFCRVVVRAANVKIRKSKIRGDDTEVINADVALFDCTHAAATAALLEDCSVIPDVPSLRMNGFRGCGATIQRCNVRNVTDGFDVWGSQDTFLYANWCHDLSGFGPDTPQNRPFTHNDIIQHLGGPGRLFSVGNNWEGFLNPNIGQAGDPAFDPNWKQSPSPTNAVYQVSQSAGLARNNVIDGDWIDGGSVSVNIAATGGAAGNYGEIKNLLCGRANYYQGGSSANDGIPGAGGDNTVVFSSKGGMTFTAPNVSVPTGSAGVVDPNGNNKFADNAHPIRIRAA